jgi:hypothetical protein
MKNNDNIVVVQVGFPDTSSNGSLHRLFACSAGGPRLYSRIRRIMQSWMLYAEDLGGLGQAPT